MFVGVSAIWGASYLQIKIALDGMNASVVVFGRVALAAAILYLAVRAREDTERAFQFARWLDGRSLLWLGRRKRSGRGEGSSGLRFDVISRG